MSNNTEFTQAAVNQLEVSLERLQSYFGNRIAISIASGTHDMWAVAVFGVDGKMIVQEMGPSLKQTIETIKSKLS